MLILSILPIVWSFVLIGNGSARQVLRNFEPFDSEANEISENNSEEPRSNRTVERINLTLPGTKWCGPGNTADDYEDLGKHEEEDKCCRDHDHCDNIPAGEMKYGLTNDDYFTRLHCKCDRDFQQCLKKINTTLSNRLGSFYFAVRDKCYKKQYPIVDCGEKKNMLFLRRCVRYVVNSSASREWQWFDLPFYDDNMINDFY
ncbi:phospholipase A2 [Culex quinquefasciatus]|uniref:Phospholipase A2 n=1 Tax=Culex quinquefasciatus TaxID=7176 RepID=B0W2R2_CULQU|nr:phospholipase A2-like [Culex pipiens pallens]EDS29815.1 phospholipase A2 [Culex quinquefasciatus]|eukprot:XP_001842996.1 phospholipase A2 [Culex quinquefasciatus]